MINSSATHKRIVLTLCVALSPGSNESTCKVKFLLKCGSDFDQMPLQMPIMICCASQQWFHHLIRLYCADVPLTTHTTHHLIAMVHMCTLHVKENKSSIYMMYELLETYIRMGKTKQNVWPTMVDTTHGSLCNFKIALSHKLSQL